MSDNADFPEKAILKKRGDKSTYDWVSIIVKYVIPRLSEFQKEGIPPTIRGMFYFLTDSQVVSKLYNVYKNFDSALVTARKKHRGDRGYIPLGAFSDNTRRIIDIDDKYRPLDMQMLGAISYLTHLPETFKKTIPRWLCQPNYVEVWIEKDAMAGTIYSILKDKQVRIAPNRGWSSLEFLHDNLERLEDQIENSRNNHHDDHDDDGLGQFESIKHIWILYVGDFDPSGLKMDELYEQELADLEVRLGGQVRLHFKRIALTWEQITKFKLEHLKNAALSDRDREKLENDPNADWFIKQYGSLFQIQSDSLQTIQLKKFKQLITGEVDRLFNENIRKQVLAIPQHSLPKAEIWEKINDAWVEKVERYEYYRDLKNDDDEQ